MKKLNSILILMLTVLMMTGLSNNLEANENDDRFDREDNNIGDRSHKHKPITMFARANEVKSQQFRGIIRIPDSLKVITIFGRDAKSYAYLTFDDHVQCLYEGRFDRRLFTFNYNFQKCSDGSRAGEEQRVESKISLVLKDSTIIPSTVYATINVLEKYLKGIKFPGLEASNGQVLKFDSGLWVPADLLPDGINNGDILSWDGASWVAKPNSGGTGTGGVGPQGPQGVQGAQGPQGAKGDKGDKGDQGVAGAQGPAGAVGAMGPQGVSGLTGSKGDKGDQGIQGIQGLKGDKGDQGIAGAAGPSGPMGPQGISGLSGANGDKGDKGDKGDQGIAGVQGPAGIMGPMGPQGPIGLTGAAGANGSNGVNGAMGPQGPEGAQGLKGDKGDPGLVSLTAGNGILGTTISGNGGTIAVNTGNSAGQIPMVEANGKLAASIIPDNFLKTVFIKDIKPSGTNGGTCDPAMGWEQIRDLNSINGDSSFVTVSSNKITLPAGTYIIEAQVPAYLDGFHKAILANANTGEFVIVGTNARSHNVGGGMEPSLISGQISIAAPTSFVIKHRCSTIMTSVGFGSALSFGVDEVYTQVKITKVK